LISRILHLEICKTLPAMHSIVYSCSNPLPLSQKTIIKTCLSAKLNDVTSQQILKPFQKINSTVSVCPYYQKHNSHQFCSKQVCQLVLCEHAKSWNRLTVVKSWLCEDGDTGPVTSGSLVETCVACCYSSHLI